MDKDFLPALAGWSPFFPLLPGGLKLPKPVLEHPPLPTSGSDELLESPAVVFPQRRSSRYCDAQVFLVLDTLLSYRDLSDQRKEDSRKDDPSAAFIGDAGKKKPLKAVSQNFIGLYIYLLGK